MDSSRGEFVKEIGPKQLKNFFSDIPEMSVSPEVLEAKVKELAGGGDGSLPILEYGEIVEIKGIKFRVKQFRQNGKLTLRMIKEDGKPLVRKWVCLKCPHIEYASTRPDACPGCGETTHERERD